MSSKTIPVQIRLPPFHYKKLEQMKEAGAISSIASFCKSAVLDRLKTEFKDFKEELSEIPC